MSRLDKLEKAVPALIAWNVVQAIGVTMSPGGQVRFFAITAEAENIPPDKLYSGNIL